MRLCDDRKRMRDKCDQTVSLLTLAAVMSQIKHWLALESAAAAAAAAGAEFALQQNQSKTNW